MAHKVSISLDIPVRFKLIANGEKVIEQTGPDEFDVNIREGALKRESWLYTLTTFIDEARREMRKSKRRKDRSRVAEFNSRPRQTMGGKKTTVTEQAQ